MGVGIAEGIGWRRGRLSWVRWRVGGWGERSTSGVDFAFGVDYLY